MYPCVYACIHPSIHPCIQVGHSIQYTCYTYVFGSVIIQAHCRFSTVVILLSMDPAQGWHAQVKKCKHSWNSKVSIRICQIEPSETDCSSRYAYDKKLREDLRGQLSRGRHLFAVGSLCHSKGNGDAGVFATHGLSNRKLCST